MVLLVQGPKFIVDIPAEGEYVDRPMTETKTEATKKRTPHRAKYPITAEWREDLKTRFIYHPPKGDQRVRYEDMRRRVALLARRILEETPKSREQSLAITKLEEASFWMNAAIARHEN